VGSIRKPRKLRQVQASPVHGELMQHRRRSRPPRFLDAPTRSFPTIEPEIVSNSHVRGCVIRGIRPRRRLSESARGHKNGSIRDRKMGESLPGAFERGLENGTVHPHVELVHLYLDQGPPIGSVQPSIRRCAFLSAPRDLRPLPNCRVLVQLMGNANHSTFQMSTMQHESSFELTAFA
jgi:hypothetical protein